ncbi:bifunctional methylenetetrahydrofolate dehydrogenase/methenyltetrahydrofolate cyclohydrolase FolD [Pelagibacterales bacterium]|jgi:methylenetetrahydrofolate dehydrogenase (NADP+)/methenyltetrahydrofolate cyclohydrolase|nr:bifunctional methylenetetrahydrofolate dehydrogenase/methenyltetrahydrofolate cyclohydrolase FolD [Pelagibacterales bacterium]
MTATIIDGKIIAAEVRAEAQIEVKKFVELYKTNPCLAVVLVGENPASQVYVRTKSKMAKEIGMDVEDHIKDIDISEKELIDLINQLNNNDKINGILVQLPLPDHIDSRVIIDAIDPIKDADGFHALNVGRNSIGGDLLKKSFVPCTPLGCYLMLKKSIPNLAGMHAVIIGRSNIVGKPMAQLLLEESCTVTTVHSKTKDIETITRQADILVAAVGRPLMVKADWIKSGAIVIDVGINRVENPDDTSKTMLVGDVDYADVINKASAITPVPGGVGPMTIACLLKNTVEAAFRQKNS